MKLYLTILALAISFIAAGQKLKYKNIFPLIEENRMEEAIPLLKQFLSDKKNADEPNANLQMAYFFEKEALESEIIRDSTRLYQTADSAVLFFFKAKQLIDDREVKKNDDYYQEFYRRDLRTGEFGIKLSDIQLEIDAKVKQLKDRTEKAGLINNRLHTIRQRYAESQDGYRQLTEVYPAYTDLLLAAGDDELAILTAMVENEALIDKAVNTITSTVIRLDNTGIDTDYIKKPIESYGSDGLTETSFADGNLEIWAYGDWAQKARHTIRTESRPLQYAIVDLYHDLLDLDKELGNNKSLEENYVWDNTQLNAIESVREYDDTPFAWHYLTHKALALRYQFLTDSMFVKELRDSSKISFRIENTGKVLDILGEQSNALSELSQIDIQEDKKKYEQLINEEGGVSVIENLISSAQKINQQRLDIFTQALDFWQNRAKWGILEGDSINLEYPVDSLVMADLDDFGIALAKAPDDTTAIYTIGLIMQNDKIVGNTTAFDDSRISMWNATFELFDANLNKRDTLSFEAAFVSSGTENLTAYLFDNFTSEGNNLTLVNTSRNGAIQWKVDLEVPNIPVKVNYNEMLGETVLFLVEEEALASLGPDQRGYIVIDRNGEVR